MLAKMWKKILLAICIIACIFNIMSKLVNRTSLELNLKSVVGSESLLSIFKEDKNDKNDKEDEEEKTSQEENVQKPSTQSAPEASEAETLDKKEQSPTSDFVVIY